MGKSIRYWMIALGCLMLASACRQEGEQAPEDTTKQAVDTLPMLILQVKKCAKLYTTEVHVHKIVTHDDVIRLKGSLLKQDFNLTVPLGDRKIAIPIDATLKASIDFSQF